MQEDNSGFLSSAHAIGTPEDVMATESLVRISKAFDYAAKAIELDAKIEQSEPEELTGFDWIGDMGRAFGNVVIGGINRYRYIRARQFEEKADILLGKKIIRFVD